MYIHAIMHGYYRDILHSNYLPLPPFPTAMTNSQPRTAWGGVTGQVQGLVELARYTGHFGLATSYFVIYLIELDQKRQLN